MKKKLISLFIAALLVFSACSPATTGKTDTQDNTQKENADTKKSGQRTLNVYNWGDYIDQELLAEFEAQTGIKVIYEEFVTNEDMYVKLKNGSNNYDIAIPSDYMIKKMVNEDMLKEIDFYKIPNYDYIPEEFKNLEFDPENKYSVPYFWGTVGILYNKTMVQEPVESWNILFDEKYADQILMLDSQRDALMIALKLLGYSMNTTNPEELKEATELLIKQKPHVAAYGVDNVKNDMVIGSAAMLPTYNGEAIALGKENEDLAFAIPKEGTNLWFDSIVIPKNAVNVEEAHEFINFLLEPEVNAKNTEYVGYSTPNKAALELLPEELRNDPVAYPNVKELKNWEVFIDLGDKIELYNEAWTKVKAAQ